MASRTVARALSTRTAIQILSGILLEAQRRRAATRCDGHGTVGARGRAGAGAGRGAIVLPGRTLVDIARLLPGDEVTIEHRAAESVVHVTSGSASYTLQTFNAEDFPRLPEHRRDADVRGRARAAAGDDRPRRARGVARRGAPGADRRSRPVRAATSSSWPRPTRTGSRSRRRRSPAPLPELEAIVPEPRAAGACAHRRRRRRDRVGVQENQVLFSAGGVLAHDAPHRRPVPELPAASAGDVRARADDRRAVELLDVVAPRRGDDPARDAAPAALRRGRAHGGRADAGGRRVEASRCRCLHRRARSRSGSTPSSSRTGSRRSRATT